MTGTRILLVEDDEVLRDLIGRNLEVRGHEVCEAEDAQSALAQLRATVFDLIVLDICLPDQPTKKKKKDDPSHCIKRCTITQAA